MDDHDNRGVRGNPPPPWESWLGAQHGGGKYHVWNFDIMIHQMFIHVCETYDQVCDMINEYEDGAEMGFRAIRKRWFLILEVARVDYISGSIAQKYGHGYLT